MIIARVKKVSSDSPDGKINVEGLGISPDEPVYYAGPPQFFSMPGIDDQVLVISAAISRRKRAWFWTCQVALPQVLGVDRETNPHGLENTTKPSEDIDGLLNPMGAALNVFGQVPSDAYTSKHGTPGVVELRDKRGNKVRLSSKGKEGEGNFIRIRSATGKQLLIEDNSPGFDTGPKPRTFKSKISGIDAKEVPSKSRILLEDRNHNRIQIDEMKDSIEVHAKNAASFTTEGGRVDIGIKKVKNSRGKVSISNDTLDGDIELVANRGYIKGNAMTGFDLFSTFDPMLPNGVGIQADTSFFTPGPMPQIGFPAPIPSLHMGWGMTIDPLTSKALTETAINYQKFSPLGITNMAALGMVDNTCLLGPVNNTAPVGPYTITSPLINLAGAVAITGPATFAGLSTSTGNSIANGTTTLNGATTVTGALTVTGATTISGAATISGVTAVTGPPHAPIAAAQALGLPLATVPGLTYNGFPVIVLAPST